MDADYKRVVMIDYDQLWNFGSYCGRLGSRHIGMNETPLMFLKWVERLIFK